MAHYAKVNSNNIVEEVFKFSDNDFPSIELPEGYQWVKTSFNTIGGVHLDPNTNQPDNGIPFRKNYAGAGYIWDPERDAFYPPKPYASWTLNETSCLWEPPTPRPDNEQDWLWDEDTQSWNL